MARFGYNPYYVSQTNPYIAQASYSNGNPYVAQQSYAYRASQPTIYPSVQPFQSYGAPQVLNQIPTAVPSSMYYGYNQQNLLPEIVPNRYSGALAATNPLYQYSNVPVARNYYPYDSTLPFTNLRQPMPVPQYSNYTTPRRRYRSRSSSSSDSTSLSRETVIYLDRASLPSIPKTKRKSIRRNPNRQDRDKPVIVGYLGRQSNNDLRSNRSRRRD